VKLLDDHTRLVEILVYDPLGAASEFLANRRALDSHGWGPELRPEPPPQPQVLSPNICRRFGRSRLGALDCGLAFQPRCIPGRLSSLPGRLPHHSTQFRAAQERTRFVIDRRIVVGRFRSDARVVISVDSQLPLKVPANFWVHVKDKFFLLKL